MYIHVDENQCVYKCNRARELVVCLLLTGVWCVTVCAGFIVLDLGCW